MTNNPEHLSSEVVTEAMINAGWDEARKRAVGASTDDVRAIYAAMTASRPDGLLEGEARRHAIFVAAFDKLHTLEHAPPGMREARRIDRKSALTILETMFHDLEANRPACGDGLGEQGEVMIGEFIARWDDAASGVSMDYDTAQALAREFKRMRAAIEAYRPTDLGAARALGPADPSRAAPSRPVGFDHGERGEK